MSIKYFSIFHIFLFLSVLISSCKTDKKENNSAVSETTDIVKSDTIKNILKIDTIHTIELSAIALTSAYVANEVKADHDYKGKKLLVTGEIININRGLADDIYVVLKGSEKNRSVQCYYPNEKDAQTLKKGMKISFKGKCDGLWVNVILIDCERIWEAGK